MKNSKAFTLIELLIVVAIIAILAAIAVPNFLEAQVRSKVSRQKANMRTVVTAMEAYAVDNNKYPYWAGTRGLATAGAVAAPAGVTFAATEQWKFYPGYPGYAAGLTTPIAYITGNSAMEDIFRLPHNFTEPLANQVMYLSTEFYADSPATYTAQDRRYGKWVLRSAGPDTYYQNYMHLSGDYGAGGWYRGSYDATNGTVSAGDIYRSQKDPDDKHAG